MPRFFFDFRDATGVISDQVGQDFPTVAQARKMALVTAGEMARDLTASGGDAQLSIEVRDGNGPVCSTRVTIKVIDGKENP
jgi:hypothetical protein